MARRKLSGLGGGRAYHTVAPPRAGDPMMGEENRRQYPLPARFSDADYLATVREYISSAMRSQGMDPSALTGGITSDPDPSAGGFYDPETRRINVSPGWDNLRDLQRVSEHEAAHAMEILGGRGFQTKPGEGYVGFDESMPGGRGQGGWHVPSWRRRQGSLFERPGGSMMRDVYRDPEVKIGGGFGSEGITRPLGWLLGKPPAKRGRLLSAYPERMEEAAGGYHEPEWLSPPRPGFAGIRPYTSTPKVYIPKYTKAAPSPSRDTPGAHTEKPATPKSRGRLPRLGGGPRQARASLL